MERSNPCEKERIQYSILIANPIIHTISAIYKHQTPTLIVRRRSNVLRLFECPMPVRTSFVVQTSYACSNVLRRSNILRMFERPTPVRTSYTVRTSSVCSNVLRLFGCPSSFKRPTPVRTSYAVRTSSVVRTSYALFSVLRRSPSSTTTVIPATLPEFVFTKFLR